MYDAIKKNVEEMIQEFFQYGIKDALSVDEFLKFREQAVKEQMMGICSRCNGLLHKKDGLVQNETEKHSKNIPAQGISPDIQNYLENNQDNIIKESTYPKNKDTQCNENTFPGTSNKEYGKPDEDREEDGFSASEFLAMMKSIED